MKKGLGKLSGNIRNSKKVYGFDTETYNNNKKFLLGSVVNGELNGKHGFKKVFYSQDDMIDWVQNSKRKKVLVATNLQFDALALFGKEKSLEPFKPFFRNSEMICGKCNNVKFLDTMNYCRMSVEKLGSLVGVSKMEKPTFLGKKPKNDEEWDYLEKYNLRDSLISFKAYKFFEESFNKLGCKIKTTIASTSMDLFRRKYLKTRFYRPDKNQILLLRNAYYGGRTEAFKRGKFKNYNYYDFNSLYPSVMLNKLPNPNSRKFCKKGTVQKIMDYEGVSEVFVKAPIMYYPILPCRIEQKLIFPCGTFKGWYSHLELRKALEFGYEILEVYNQFWYTSTVSPFNDYVKNLYKLRMDFKRQNSPIQLSVKLLLNSLYGKFGQKTEAVSEVKFIDDVKKLDDNMTVCGDYVTIKKDLCEKKIPPFVIPEWCVYITAYARLKLWEKLKSCKGIYCDTDSIITKKEIIDSQDMGMLKLEHKIKEIVIVRPKFYLLDGEVKLKGFHRAKEQDFHEILKGRPVEFQKFLKFRETLKRVSDEPYFNKPISVIKQFALEDVKRIWEKPFCLGETDSKPIYLKI